ncbi:MAG: hypothetical protein QXI36_01180 [Candidatus Bathyarchaeia archaeon]
MKRKFKGVASMFRIHNMKVEDVETVARIVALDHSDEYEEGFRTAYSHTMDHLKMVPQHCYVVENDVGDIVAAMVLHPREEVFEIEDFHVRKVHQNREALDQLKAKLMEYLENVKTEVLCCPYALRRLIKTP